MQNALHFWLKGFSYAFWCCSYKYNPYLDKSKVELCVRDIDTWVLHSGLKLNPDKSELLVPSELDSVADVDELITAELRARNLGVILDTHLSLNHHIAKGCKTFFLEKTFILEMSVEILIHAFVRSKLDFCNSLLYGPPAFQLNKLRLIQNNATRVVSFIQKIWSHYTSTSRFPMVPGTT